MGGRTILAIETEESWTKAWQMWSSFRDPLANTAYRPREKRHAKSHSGNALTVADYES